MSAPHPSTVITPEHTAIFRDNAALGEQLGKLHPYQLQLIHQLQWFKLLVPQVYGGLETSLPDLIRLQEAISWADGSAGWVVTLCCGAGWFGGFIAPDAAMPIFSTPNVCLAGSGADSGEAEKIPGGYRINGTWKYASGAYHASHFTANCTITENGKPVLDDTGEPLVRPFVIDKNQVALLPAWGYVGMVATGSHSFIIDNAEVEANRCFRINPDHAQVNGLLYQYPFLQLAEATLAVNLSGMAVHFTDLCKDVFEARSKMPKITQAQKAYMFDTLQAAISALQAARDSLFAAVGASWAEQPGNWGNALLEVSKNSRQLAIVSRQVVDTLYPYCGLTAAAPNTEINRVWRDIHTAGQHSLLTFAG